MDLSQDKNSGIPEMDLNQKYSSKGPALPPSEEQMNKEMDKTKKELDKLKTWLVKKYKFIQALSILPQQSVPLFITEEEIPKETEKFIQLYMIIPEEHFKEIPKIKKEIVPELEKLKEKVWLQIKTPVDVWENCFDSKFDLTAAIALSYPIHDTGFLSALRVAEIHKSLVLQKFEKYVVSYVVGGSLVRGDVVKESDVDVFVIINDTDVKRMPRLELKERLRSIIVGQHTNQAESLAGVKPRTLNVQTYLLTEFWDSVKDANPVMFTFIRDGVPLYDRGTFLPWKALLKMGKLKPSPEAIDMFMSSGDKTVKRAKMALMDILVHDIYWGVLYPAQAMFMLNGLPPPSHKEVIQGAFRKVFVEKEKMIEAKYATILEEIVQLYKDYEHEKLKEIPGAKIDKLLKNSEDFIKRMKELRKQIDKRSQEKTIEELDKEIIDLLKIIVGKMAKSKLVEKFEKDFVKKGKFPSQSMKILNEVLEAKAKFKKGKLNLHKVDDIRKKASVLINDLVDYTQRCDLVSLEKGRMMLKYKEGNKEQIAELVNADGKTFLVRGTNVDKIGTKIDSVKIDELNSALEKQKSSGNVNIHPEIFNVLKKELGEFEIVM